MNPYVSSRKLTNANSSEVSHKDTDLQKGSLTHMLEAVQRPHFTSRIPEDGTVNWPNMNIAPQSPDSWYQVQYVVQIVQPNINSKLRREEK
jgi:hypothetical protein